MNPAFLNFLSACGADMVSEQDVVKLVCLEKSEPCAALRMNTSALSES